MIESQKDMMDQMGQGGGERKLGMRAHKNLPPIDIDFDYKNPELLRNFITETGKITPARNNRLNRFQQTRLTDAIKRARILALLPFADIHKI